MRQIIRNMIPVLLAAVLLASCATVDTGRGPAVGGAVSEPYYYGYGSGDSAVEAIRSARQDLIRQAAVDLIGPAAAAAKAQQLDNLLDSIPDYTPFIVRDSQITIDSGMNGNYFYHLGIQVRLSALASRLTAADILGGQVDGISGKTYLLPNQKKPAAPVEKPAGTPEAEEKAPAEAARPQPDESPVQRATAEELETINSYLDSMSYMVYFNEDTPADPSLMRTAVISANRYLEQQGYDYVDLARIEAIKEDQQMVYEEETGEAVSIIQWIAHKLNADIYIEVSLDANSRSEGARHYGSANVTLNCYEASTAEGRGSAVYQTNPPAFSTVSESDALSNAVSSAVFKAMDNAVRSAETETRRALASGFRYRLILVNTGDSRLLRDFEKRIERRVKDIKRVSFSPEETVFEVRMIGDMTDLEDLVYDAADSIPGLEGMMLVMQQRSAITFDTGM